MPGSLRSGLKHLLDKLVRDAGRCAAWHPSVAACARRFFLDFRAFANVGIDWLQIQDAVVAREGRTDPLALINADCGVTHLCEP